MPKILSLQVSNRRSRRWLNDRLLMELVPRLNAEEIRGLFAPPPFGKISLGVMLFLNWSFILFQLMIILELTTFGSKVWGSSSASLTLIEHKVPMYHR